MVPLRDHVALLTGFPFKSEFYTEQTDGVRLLRGDNVVQGQLRWDNIKRWPLDRVDEAKGYELRESGVVLAMDSPWIEAGLKYARIGSDDIPSLIVQRVASRSLATTCAGLSVLHVRARCPAAWKG